MTPVVLHHGLFGFGNLRLGPVTLPYFRGIDRAIADLGHPVIVTGVHPSSNVETRAAQLRDCVIQNLRERGLTGRKIILVAHSMGGLDARWAISHLGLNEHVEALVTVTSPHRGSPFADWVMTHLGRRLRGIELVKFLHLDLRAIPDLTTGACAERNARTPDVPGIRYFSVSAARPWNRMPAFAMHSHSVIQKIDGENDGLVSVRSSTWGEHLGVWPADHWHTINRRWKLEFANPVGNIAPYWVRLIQHVTEARET